MRAVLFFTVPVVFSIASTLGCSAEKAPLASAQTSRKTEAHQPEQTAKNKPAPGKEPAFDAKDYERTFARIEAQIDLRDKGPDNPIQNARYMGAWRAKFKEDLLGLVGKEIAWEGKAISIAIPRDGDKTTKIVLAPPEKESDVLRVTWAPFLVAVAQAEGIDVKRPVAFKARICKVDLPPAVKADGPDRDSVVVCIGLHFDKADLGR